MKLSYRSLCLCLLLRIKFMAMLSSIHIDLEDGMLEDPVLEEGVFED